MPKVQTRPQVSQAIPAEELDRFAAQKAALLARAREREQPGPEVIPADPISEANLLERMKRRFGLGDDPQKRLKFYEQVVNIVSSRGQLALDLVNKAAAQAVSARQPGRYFASLVKILFAERGIHFSTVDAKSAW